MNGARMLYMIVVLLPWQAFAAEPLQRYFEQSRCEDFSAATAEQLQQARDLFTRSLQADDLDSPELAAAWQAIGFDWLQAEHQGTSYRVAREAAAGCRGRGFYAFSDDRQRQVVLQVPHRFKDRHTGTLALALAAAAPFRAIAWNSAPRRIERATGTQQTDLAHRWDTYFVAFSEAFAAVLPQGRLVQLHGFATGKRKSAQAASASMVLSAGSHWPSPAVLTVQACLARTFGNGVRLFPRDIDELGATRNVQGRLLRSLGHGGFVHVELSDGLRDELGQNHAPVQALAACLAGGDA